MSENEAKSGNGNGSIPDLDKIDHVAIQVNDLNATVDWYLEKFKCTVVYQDETWAMIKFNNISLAFVIPDQHPEHIGIIREDAESYGKLKGHRDGTESCYVKDPSENFVEVLKPY